MKKGSFALSDSPLTSPLEAQAEDFKKERFLALVKDGNVEEGQHQQQKEAEKEQEVEKEEEEHPFSPAAIFEFKQSFLGNNRSFSKEESEGEENGAEQEKNKEKKQKDRKKRTLFDHEELASASEHFDPSSSVVDYSSLPRYGFPEKTEPAIVVREQARTNVILQQHSKAAELAWREGLKGLPLLSQADEQTIECLRKIAKKYAIPADLRSVVWLTITRVAAKLEEFPLVSEEGKNGGLCAALSTLPLPPKSVCQAIEQDLLRTFTTHEYFRESGEGHAKLRQLLYAIYRRNPSSGYAQSWNFIVATVLLALGGDVEASLHLILVIFESLLPNDYYSCNLNGIRIDQQVLDDLVRSHAPKAHAHFMNVGFEVGLLVPTWLMSCFASCLPFSTALAVWDLALSMYDTRLQTPVFLAVAVALIKLNENSLLVIHDPSDVAMFLSQLAEISFNFPALIREVASLCNSGINPEIVSKLRRKYRQQAHQQERSAVTASGGGGGGVGNGRNQRFEAEIRLLQERLALLRKGGAQAKALALNSTRFENDSMFINNSSSGGGGGSSSPPITPLSPTAMSSSSSSSSSPSSGNHTTQEDLLSAALRESSTLSSSPSSSSNSKGGGKVEEVEMGSFKKKR